MIRAMKPALLSALLLFAMYASPQSTGAEKEVGGVFPDAYKLYVDLHQSPELSSHETQTASKMAERLRALGYEVTDHVGGTGVVAIMKNGNGPTVMLRTELDALPVEEKTGLPYASKVRTKDDAGHDVAVMHACGHDLHMASLYGTAAVMAKEKQSWHGTLMLIGQPAEETITGAKRMIDDGLFKRFPKPDVGVSMHTSNLLPAGKVGVGPGYRYANADSLRLTIFGKGGHGSAPETTIDPIVIAARTIVALQTITSREVKPGEPAVITVGYIHAGNKNNIIPDDAELGLTVRSYKPETRKLLLSSIARVAKAEAEAAGAQRMPEVEHYETTDAVYNEPALNSRLRAPLEAALGKDNVVDVEPIMGSEDYSYFIEEGVPSFYYGLGGANPQKWSDAKGKGERLPSNHSSLFAPDAEPALRAGIASEVSVLRNLLSTSRADLLKSLPAQTTAHQ
jgi:amidohydrolase